MGVVVCKQRDLVSRQGKKYTRFKRAVIAEMNKGAILSPPIPAQVLYQPEGSEQDLTSYEGCALLLTLSVFSSSVCPFFLMPAVTWDIYITPPPFWSLSTFVMPG